MRTKIVLNSDIRVDASGKCFDPLKLLKGNQMTDKGLCVYNCMIKTTNLSNFAALYTK